MLIRLESRSKFTVDVQIHSLTDSGNVSRRCLAFTKLR